MNVRGGSGQMFDAIAGRYDLVNRVISLGLDQRWRRTAVERLELQPGHRVLDVATGTGDVAARVLEACPTAIVTGVDPSRGMLDVARVKPACKGVRFEEGDAMALPFGDATFDRAIIAFGIRNVADRPRGLAEIHRVLAPRGRLVVLELTEPAGGPLAPIARTFVHRVVPRVGALLSGADEYRYLERSIAAFPPAEAFADMVTEAGFATCRIEPVIAGVACVFVAERGAS